MHYLHRAALLSERAGDKRFQEKIGIGRTLFLILRSVAEKDAVGNGASSLSQQAIARHLSLTKGAVSRHVETARQRGWLISDPSAATRREHSLVLTPSGRALVERGLTVQHDYERLSDKQLTEAAIATTTETLKTICQLLEAEEQG